MPRAVLISRPKDARRSVARGQQNMADAAGGGPLPSAQEAVGVQVHREAEFSEARSATSALDVTMSARRTWADPRKNCIDSPLRREPIPPHPILIRKPNKSRHTAHHPKKPESRQETIRLPRPNPAIDLPLTEDKPEPKRRATPKQRTP